MSKILGVAIEIRNRLQIIIFVSKFKIYLSESPNGSIRNFMVRIEICTLFTKSAVYRGFSHRNFSVTSENKVLGHFIDIWMFFVADIAYLVDESNILLLAVINMLRRVIKAIGMGGVCGRDDEGEQGCVGG